VRSLGEQFRDEPRFSDDHCSLYRWAQFNIDNDGRSELVIKWSACLGGIRSDVLYMFRGDAPRSSVYDKMMDKTKRDQKGFLGELSYTGGWYELKKLPPFKDKRGRSQLHGIGGKVWIHPFLFDG
jgi:hypothetical protein